MNCRRALWCLSKLCSFVTASGLLWAAFASAEEIKSGLGKSIGHVAPGGIAVYRSEKWAQVNVELVNPTDEPIELLTATFFQDEPSLQYGRRNWIPAKSRLQTWHVLRIPRTGANRTVNTRTLVMDARQEREVLLRGDGGYLHLDGLVRLTDEDSVTGMFEAPSDPPPPGRIFPDENEDATSNLVTASRIEAQRTRRLSYPVDQVFPSSEECLNGLDQMVITDSRVADDSAGLVAMRRWLFGGGHMWVMLDQTDPRVLQRLLGDDFVCEVVDRVGLTTVRLTEPDAGTSVVSTQDYEHPVEFVRVAVSDVDVAYTVDGWPAAFWKNCGEGRLLVTTLGPRGWMRRRTDADNAAPQNRGPQRRGREPPPETESSAPDDLRAPTAHAVLEPMSNLALQLFNQPLPRLLPETVLEPLTQEYVGYAIPSRTMVLGLLVGFSALLMGLGTWLWRQNRLEFLGAIGPGIALSISALLVLLGQQQRNAVPPTAANLQYVQSIPGTDDVRVSGVVGLFSPEAGTSAVSAQHGGWLLPEASGLESTTRRMVWTDHGAWSWEHLPETVGLRSATFQTATEFTERLEARATFGPEGLTGHLHLPDAHRPADAMLATRDGRFGVELRGDDTFTAKADNVLAGDQFLDAGLLSDEQVRRRRLLQQLLTNPLRRDFPKAPLLFLWTKPWDIGFRFGENRRSVGSALVAVPLKLQRPATGTEVRIASPFLPYRGALGPDDLVPSGWWDSQQHQWIEKARPTETWLRFQIPTVLLPIAIERGRVTVQVKGPVGKLTLAGHRPSTNAVVPIKTWIDPVGTLSLEITDHELLSVSADGGLLLRVSAGDADRPELTQLEATETSIMSYWQIESLSLELNAKTIAAAP